MGFGQSGERATHIKFCLSWLWHIKLSIINNIKGFVAWRESIDARVNKSDQKWKAKSWHRGPIASNKYLISFRWLTGESTLALLLAHSINRDISKRWDLSTKWLALPSVISENYSFTDSRTAFKLERWTWNEIKTDFEKMKQPFVPTAKSNGWRCSVVNIHETQTKSESSADEMYTEVDWWTICSSSTAVHRRNFNPKSRKLLSKQSIIARLLALLDCVTKISQVNAKNDSVLYKIGNGNSRGFRNSYCKGSRKKLNPFHVWLMNSVEFTVSQYFRIQLVRRVLRFIVSSFQKNQIFLFCLLFVSSSCASCWQVPGRSLLIRI